MRLKSGTDYGTGSVEAADMWQFWRWKARVKEAVTGQLAVSHAAKKENLAHKVADGIRELSSPRLDQSASRPVRELAIRELAYPRVVQ